MEVVGNELPLLPDGSGWLCYPGKLKHGLVCRWSQVVGGSGWLCYPGKLKPAFGKKVRAAFVQGSGWLCYPGKLKPTAEALIHQLQVVPDGFAIRGS